MDTHIRTTGLSIVLCLLVLVLVVLYGPRRDQAISYEDRATITVTARLLRQSSVNPKWVDDETISGLLVQFGYKDCRNRQYLDDVEICRQSIRKREIELVRIKIQGGSQ